jgi:Secretion system C-terminal sorting domain
LVTSIIVHKNELYAAAPNKGVFKSPDGGSTWQEISSGNDTLDVSDFCEFRGDLYASTLGNSVYKLDPVTRNRWLSFKNGLGSISEVATALAATSNTMIAGTLNNGLYDYLPANSATWEERFLLPRISVNEGSFYIITAHDTLFWPGRTGFFYMSTDGGLNWNHFGNRLTTGNNSIVNAKQALLASRYFFDGVNFINAFYYLKKDSLQNQFVNFSVVPDRFTWQIDILGDKLWDATDRGLFFMPLSNLPGITSADDSLPIILPVRFTSFTANCQSNKVLLTWITTQEQNSSHFKVEKSVDGISWKVTGNVPVDGHNTPAKNYSFTDNTSLQDNYYRIAEYDLDGKVQYTNVLKSTCDAAEALSLWPNPVHDIAFINIISANESQALIKVFDGKGALMKIKKVTVQKGSNQFSLDISSLASGIYSLSITSGDEQVNKVIQLIKN